MPDTTPILPAGTRLERHAQLASTNAAAMARAEAGDEPGLWIMADGQSAGRGRSGRVWTSPVGNLYASLFIAPSCALAEAPQLALVAGVATHGAITSVAGGRITPAALRLKWPNDLLLGGAKAAGILLESAWSETWQRRNVVVGIGINLAAHPEGLDQPATSLRAYGAEVDPSRMLGALAGALDHWIGVWDAGRGFENVRQRWQELGPRTGQAIRVREGERRLEGIFCGLEADGALRLGGEGGRVVRILSGDIETADAASCAG